MLPDTVVGPFSTMFLGTYQGLAPRTSFWSSMIVNSMGETALIFIMQGHRAALIDQEVFSVLVVACWLTLIFSAILQVMLTLSSQGKKENKSFCDHYIIIRLTHRFSAPHSQHFRRDRRPPCRPEQTDESQDVSSRTRARTGGNWSVHARRR